MQVTVYPGPEKSSVAALNAQLAKTDSPRLVSQVWTGESLLVVFDTGFDGHIAKVLLSIVAAAILAFAGYQMVGLHSVGGNSVAELFDNAVGIMCFGLGALSLAYAAG
jgi:hypothetical protein